MTEHLYLVFPMPGSSECQTTTSRPLSKNVSVFSRVTTTLPSYVSNELSGLLLYQQVHPAPSEGPPSTKTRPKDFLFTLLTYPVCPSRTESVPAPVPNVRPTRGTRT